MENVPWEPPNPIVELVLLDLHSSLIFFVSGAIMLTSAMHTDEVGSTNFMMR